MLLRILQSKSSTIRVLATLSGRISGRQWRTRCTTFKTNIYNCSAVIKTQSWQCIDAMNVGVIRTENWRTFIVHRCNRLPFTLVLFYGEYVSACFCVSQRFTFSYRIMSHSMCKVGKTRSNIYTSSNKNSSIFVQCHFHVCMQMHSQIQLTRTNITPYNFLSPHQSQHHQQPPLPISMFTLEQKRQWQWRFVTTTTTTVAAAQCVTSRLLRLLVLDARHCGCDSRQLNRAHRLLWSGATLLAHWSVFFSQHAKDNAVNIHAQVSTHPRPLHTLLTSSQQQRQWRLWWFQPGCSSRACRLCAYIVTI